MSNTFLYAEVNIVCILFLLLISLKANKCMFLQNQRRTFIGVAVSNMVLFSLDAIWIFVNSDILAISKAWNWVLNVAYYMVSGLSGYIWFLYSETIQQSRFVKDKKLGLLALLPAVVLVVLTILSYQNHLLFYIDDSNAYHRGPAYSLQLVLAYGYVIFTAVKAFVRSFYVEDYHRKVEFISLSTFVIPTLVGGILQVFFPTYPILCVGSTIGILYIYLTRQEQMVSVDELTQLNNRNQLFQYLSVRFRHISDDEPLYLFMLDVNKFKLINDQYGHTEGDRALRLVAGSIRKSCNQKGAFVARYGGDEFTVVCELYNSHSPEEVMDRINEAVKQNKVPYHLSLSIGYAKYTKNIRTQQELISLADKELYKAKKKFHQANNVK